ATAKWILGAAAAVGAALLGGAPLTATGRLHGAADTATAYLGLLVALLGVGWAIWHTADALIPPLTTSSSLDQSPRLHDLRDRVRREPGAFYGSFGTSMAELQGALRLHRTIAVNLQRALSAEPDPARRAVLTTALRD